MRFPDKLGTAAVGSLPARPARVFQPAWSQHRAHKCRLARRRLGVGLNAASIDDRQEGDHRYHLLMACNRSPMVCIRSPRQGRRPLATGGAQRNPWLARPSDRLPPWAGAEESRSWMFPRHLGVVSGNGALLCPSRAPILTVTHYSHGLRSAPPVAKRLCPCRGRVRLPPRPGIRSCNLTGRPCCASDVRSAAGRHPAFSGPDRGNCASALSLPKGICAQWIAARVSLCTLYTEFKRRWLPRRCSRRCAAAWTVPRHRRRGWANRR